MRNFCLTLFALLLANGAHAAVIFGDTEFLDADWSIVEIRDDGGNSIGTGAQQVAGGNPGAYWEGTNVMGGVTLVRYAHMYIASTYDPSTQGAISSIDWTYDFITLSATNPSNGAVASNILLEQGGIYYLSGPGLTLSTGSPWTANSSLGAIESSFGAVDGAGNPDFSASGGVITFGFLSSNSTNNALGRTTTWGLDNWQMVVNQQQQPPSGLPGPASILLLGLGIAGMAYSKKKG